MSCYTKNSKSGMLSWCTIGTHEGMYVSSEVMFRSVPDLSGKELGKLPHRVAHSKYASSTIIPVTPRSEESLRCKLEPDEELEPCDAYTAFDHTPFPQSKEVYEVRLPV